MHKTRRIQAVYQELDIYPIYNVGYSPEFNPIESVFSQVKRRYCRERLNKLVNGEEFNTNIAIRTAFAKITTKLIENCVILSDRLLRTFK